MFGFPVEHSLSPAMHNAALAALSLHYVYIPYSVQPDEIGPAICSLRTLGIVGVNLTIPHKERALPFLDESAPEAVAVGAVNTVYNNDGRLIGYNTDGEGFIAPLKARGIDLRGLRAVVLGAGGAARSVAYRLVREGARIVLVNRTVDRAKRLADAVNTASRSAGVEWLRFGDQAGLIEALAGADLLVNTTSVGMHPHVDAMPDVPPSALRAGLTVYDLVYNPLETRLLATARERGASTVTGLQMLVHQGAASLRIWTGVSPPVDVMERAVLSALGRSNASAVGRNG